MPLRFGANLGVIGLTLPKGLIRMLSLRAQNMVESLVEVVNDLADELSKTHEVVTVMINIDAGADGIPVLLESSRD